MPKLIDRPPCICSLCNKSFRTKANGHPFLHNIKGHGWQCPGSFKAGLMIDEVEYIIDAHDMVSFPQASLRYKISPFTIRRIYLRLIAREAFTPKD